MVGDTAGEGETRVYTLLLTEYVSVSSNVRIIKVLLLLNFSFSRRG
jgi:hypothetical protein